MALDAWYLGPSGRVGFWTLAPDTLAVVRLWCAGLALLLLTAVAIVRFAPPTRLGVAGSLWRRTLWLVGLAECCLWPGVVLFAVGDGLRPVFLTGALAMSAYGLAYPGAPLPAAPGGAGRKLTD
jgi:hypothetical protein